MKIEKRTIFALTASLLGLGFGPQALAQEDTVFEEVIVTATKRELSIYDVPVAITAFTADAIEKQGIRNLTDGGAINIITIEAPLEIPVHREEVHQRILKERATDNTQAPASPHQTE